MISNTYANKILNAMVGISDSISRPSYVYFGLCTTEPNASTGAVTGEPTAASYARKLVGGSNAGTGIFGSANGGVIKNSTELQMKTAREEWTTGEDKLNYWFLSESATGVATIWGKVYDIDGNEGIAVPTGTVPTFYEEQLQASIDVPLEQSTEE